MDLLKQKSQIIEKIARMEKLALVFDVDGTIYPQDSEYARRLFPAIAETWNQTAKDHPVVAAKFEEILKAKNIENPDEVTAENLTTVYKSIIATYIALEDEANSLDEIEFVQNLISNMFGDNYKLIKADQDLSSTFNVLKMALSHEIAFFFDTNSPSGDMDGPDYPVQKIIRRVTGDENLVTHSKSNTFDLIDSERAGRDKKDPAHYTEDFCPRFNAIAKDTVMFDDKLQHVLAASKAGLTGIWVVTSIKTIDPEDLKITQENGILPVDNLSGFVEDIIDARMAA